MTEKKEPLFAEGVHTLSNSVFFRVRTHDQNFIP